MTLVEDLRRQATLRPDAPAVEERSYAWLEARANAVAAALRARGVRPGDRVAFRLPRGPDALAVMQGIWRVGAAYVPIDPLSPAARTALVLADCQVRLLVSDEDGPGEVLSLNAIPDAAPPEPVHPAQGADLAYILYTSGSTGTPKGVCLSHDNARAFVDWAAGALGLGPEDRLANHAPFHFDISVLDLYAALRVGASVHLVPELAAAAPATLVRFLQQRRITVWYSVPSAIVAMIEDGGLLEADLPDLRWWCFAGEPFPIHPLRRLYAAFAPRVRLFNLYGPTETNVCTAHELTAFPSEDAVPIGEAVCGDHVWAVRADGEVAEVGEEGELRVSGPTVMIGYWGREPQGDAPYPTGDWVRRLDQRSYLYLRRVDQLIKHRGYRIEPAEVELALSSHPKVREAAVLVAGDHLWAVVGATEAPSLLELKRHSAQRLPRYMILERLRVLPALPRTRNGKIDRRALLEMLTCQN